MKNAKIVWVILIVVALLSAGSFFLPYASADKETKAIMEEYPEEMYLSEINMTNRKGINLSLVEYFRIYSYMARNMTGSTKTNSVFSVVLMAIMGGLTLLQVLFALLKKPVPVMIFSVLGIAASFLFGYDLKSRGIVDGSPYRFSIAYYLLFILPALLFVLSIVAIVLRKKSK